MPKQNRPLVRDGRIQAKKKRTDRSYLRPEAAPAETVTEEELPEGEPQDASAVVRAAVSAAAEPSMPEPTAAFAPPAAAAPDSAVPFQRTPSGKLPTAVRAIQQQGVRKRREFDVQALAIRDTKYAIHELRRIAILASMVVITLIVLALVLR